jgi:hypothetical protein
MEWLPTDREEVLKDALPLLRVALPREVAPSLKVTLPVGVPVVLELTVAVKVTDWPDTEGLTDEITPVVVDALFTVRLPVAVRVVGVGFLSSVALNVKLSLVTAGVVAEVSIVKVPS